MMIEKITEYDLEAADLVIKTWDSTISIRDHVAIFLSNIRLTERKKIITYVNKQYDYMDADELCNSIEFGDHNN